MKETEAKRKLVRNIVKINLLCLVISTAVYALSDLFYGLLTFGICIILLPAAKQLIRKNQDK